MDLVEGKASYFSLLTSANSAMHLEAYDIGDHLLETATSSGANTGTGTMAELRISRSSTDIAYVVIHDSGNYFVVDAICTDAPGVGKAAGTVAVSPRVGPQGTSFRFAYVCPKSTSPKLAITDGSGAPVTQGVTIGLAVSPNGRQYVQAAVVRPVGTFFGVVTCDGKRQGSASVLVKAALGRGKYVALGDSYASGEGTYSYDSNALACHRGPVAWPRLLEGASDELGPIEHKACTGAVTADLFRSHKGQPAQIPTTSNPDIGLVTISIGGNDVGFDGILRACYLPVTTCAGTENDSNFNAKLTTLSDYLAGTVYPALGKAYPNARIVHVGYPQLTPSVGQTPVGCGWLGPDEQWTGERLPEKLNGAIKNAVGRQSRVEFLDVTNILAGHELCTSSSWMHQVNATDSSERGHPMTMGQLAYEKRVAAGLGITLTGGGGW
jgi:hypothetical protein